MDLRKLKDQALQALQKGNFDLAAELYVQIAEETPHEPDWRQRAGDAFRKAERLDDAIKQLVFAAAGYARAGFLLKAIAVCKAVLHIDPRHENVQDKLADLYSQRDPSRTPSGSFVALPLNPDDAPPSPLEQALAAVADSSSPRGAAPLGGQLAALDEIVQHGAPLDSVPLATVLDGRKSGDFATESVDGQTGEAVATAYEIDLTIDDDEEEHAELPLVEPEAPRETDPIETAAAPEPLSSPSEPLSSLSEPLSSPGEPRLDRIDDELDLSTLFDAEPLPSLPKVPLLSSLAPARLRKVIERCKARSFEAGDEILHEGERGGSLFVVVSGRVRVTVAGPTDREVAMLGDGEFFGELGWLTDFPRSATVQADLPTEVLEFSRDVISEVVADSPEVLRTLLRFFRDRLLERLLRSSELFQLFEPEDARAVAERFVFLELEPKLRVIHEGKRAPGLFLILCGEVQVAQNGVKLATLGPGDVFGEMSLLDGGPAMASIDTLTKCWALELPRAKFQEIVVAYPQMLEYVSGLAERRRAVNQARESRVDYL